MAKKSKEKEKKSGKKSSKTPLPTPGEVPPLTESASLAREKAKAPKMPVGTTPAKKSDPAPSAIFQAPAKAEPVQGKAAPAKAATKTETAKRPGKAAKMPEISEADISLRAYFIAEKRRNAMLSGDDREDWIEAERQLRAEGGAPSMRARTSGKL